MKNVICLILIPLIVLFGICDSQVVTENVLKDSSSDEIFTTSDFPTTGTDKATSQSDETNPLTDQGTSQSDETNPFDQVTDQGTSQSDETKPFDQVSDQGTSQSDETNTFDEVSDQGTSQSDETNPFDQVTDQGTSQSDETNPFDQVTDQGTSQSDETNPFDQTTDQGTSQSEETNPFDVEEVTVDGTSFNDETNPFAPENLANLTLSFRQLNGFSQEGDTVSFYFYGLTTTRIEIGYEIYIYFDLRLSGGESGDITEVKCVAEEDADPTAWLPVQAAFKCTIDGLENQYHTFKFSSSEFIAGIPYDNPTLLDPVLTNEAIQKGEILDYSLDENKEKVPNMLVVDSIDTSLSESEGTFKIIGKMGGDVQEEVTIRIPMLYPLGAVCTIPISNAQQQISIECKLSGSSNNEPLVLEQMTLGDGQFLFRGFKTEPINCINGELKFAQRFLDLSLSFRQLNKFEIASDKIMFKFFGLTTQKIQQGFQITLFLHLKLENGNLDQALSQATCTLSEEVNPTNGQSQADFDCEINEFDTTKAYKSFELSHTDDVAGIPEDKTLLDPVQTAEAIDKGLLLDFCVEKNKSKLPVIFTPSSIEESSCYENGEFKITGTTNTKIESKIQFDLKASYPEELMTKCTLDTDGTELKCVIGNKLESKPLMFEQQILRNGLNELLTFVPIQSNEEMNCAEGNMTIFDDLSEGTEQIVDSTEQIADSTEQIADSTEQIADSTEQIVADTEQIVPDTEQIVDSTEQIVPDTEQIVADTEQIVADTEQIVPDTDETKTTDKSESSNEISPIDNNPTDKDNVPTEKPEEPQQNATETDKTIEEEQIEEAKARLNITILFRQINKFTFSSNTITFWLFTLVKEQFKSGEKITVLVNLIKESGEIEDTTEEIACSLESDVTPPEGQVAQGNFRCTLNGLTEPYFSLKLNSSDSVSSIPIDDEVALDPVLTADAIEKGKILDYSLEENQKEDKIPAIFNSKMIEEDTCGNNGKFLIKGILSKNLKNDLKFNLPVTYPEGCSLVCEVTNKEAGESQISCQVDMSFYNMEVIIEQTMIKDGSEEVLLLGSIGSTEGITCQNGLLLEADKRMELSISFRQVSHFEKTDNGFSFFFAALVTKQLQVGFTLNINVVIVVGDEKKEKVGKCSLLRDVSPNEGEILQGDFKCEVALEQNEYDNLNFTDTEAIKISSNNEEIGGISELEDEEASPVATDMAIKETKEAQENNDYNLPELAECVDYYEEENKNIIPPDFEVTSIEDVEQCKNKGKLRIRGRFSSQINKEMNFFLPLSFPASTAKCKVFESPANEEVEVTCKMQKEFKDINSFNFENRMIKNRRKEMVFIKNKKINFRSPCECENYNTIRLDLANKRHNADFSFLQLSKFQPVGRKAGFFMALTRRNNAPVDERHMEINVRYISRLNNLRQLQQSSGAVDLPVTCSVASELDTACGFNCLTDKDANGTPVGMQLNTDDIDDISAIPDDVDPSKLNYAVDYSDPENLKIIDSLPTVEIESIDGSDCEEDGSYTIKGKVTGGELNNYSNVVIPFGSPDSNGLCDITVNNKDVTMKCHNKEKFDISSIIIESQVIQDSENKEILKINSFYNQKRFACAMSVYSEIETPEDNNSTTNTPNTPNTPTTTNTPTTLNNIPMRKSSGGLSGGAIAAIVICSIVALAIVGIAFALAKSGKFSSHNQQQSDYSLRTNSTANHFPVAGQNQY